MTLEKLLTVGNDLTIDNQNKVKMECQLKSSSSFGSCEQTYIKQLAETAEKIEQEINNTKTKIMNLMNLSLYMIQIQCNKNVTNFVFLGSKVIPEKHSRFTCSDN